MLGTPTFYRRGLLLVTLAVVGSCKFPPLPDLDDAATDGGDATAGDAADASSDAAMCTQTTCTAGVLEVCGASGNVESVETCRLGCFSNDRCNRVDPSNGLGAQVDGAAGLTAVTLPSGATINSDTGEIRSGGQVVAVATETVAQTGGPTLRVFMARSFTIGDVRVSGNVPVAFVAYRDVVLQGIVDVSADVGVAGAGALACSGSGRGNNQPNGYWANRRAGHNGSGQYIWSSAGAGGGGFGSVGGNGGNNDLSQGGSGGALNGGAELTPLRGGCPGGGVNNGNVDVGNGGLGGGAVQVVSATGEIVLMGASPALGGVHAGGSGARGCDNNGGTTTSPPGTGCGTGGGGSGGGVLLEAAAVRFEMGAVVLASGGGGGGSGGCGNPRHGEDAVPNGATAAGGSCPAESWGTPAPGGSGAAASAAQDGGSVTYFVGGGGGGGLGRIRINTSDGTYSGGSNVIARGAMTTGVVTTR